MQRRKDLIVVVSNVVSGILFARFPMSSVLAMIVAFFYDVERLFWGF